MKNEIDKKLENDAAVHWQPGMPLPKWADKHTMALIAYHHGEPISPEGLKFHPLKVTKPGRANLFDVSYALKYFESRIAAAGVHRVGSIRVRGQARKGLKVLR